MTKSQRKSELRLGDANVRQRRSLPKGLVILKHWLS
jgi:hypothetical protein